MAAEKELYVLRLGGSLLTPRDEDTPRINAEAIHLVVQELKRAWSRKDFSLIITHGMGSYGHPIAKEHEINSPRMHERKVFGTALLARSLTELNARLIAALLEHRVPAISHPPIGAITDNGVIVEKPLDALERMLAHGFVPVVQAFPSMDLSQGVAILSSDHISPYLAARLRATLSIIAIGIDGIYDENPKENPHARLLPRITPESAAALVKGIGSAGYVDVTGGMQRTLSEALSGVREGVSTRILNGMKPGVLSEAILGEAEHGTLVTAARP